MKTKTIFFCQDCGNESPKWSGKCSSCGAWNTMVEEKVSAKQNKQTIAPYWSEMLPNQKAKAMPITDIATEQEQRIILKDNELNRVLGGGLVLGSVVLAAGEPGIGKSTLFLQAAIQFPSIKCLYVSGEESVQQIKMRADRIATQHNNLFLLTTTSTKTIFEEIVAIHPQWVIIDSIQTMMAPILESAAGSVSQVKECTAEIQQFAKQSNIPFIIIGHITKDGTIAGPKVLEHAVDTVLQFEGDRHFAYRILRSIKNRFGSTSEIGIYEMSNTGMKEVSNPSDILMSQHTESMSGIAIAGTVEGIRPIMIEVQALVSNAVYGTPQRTNQGFELRRLQLLLAVLEKRGGFHFGTKDVFINIAGGLKIEDPAIDLAIICALLSSYQDVALPANICFVGEVGLSGEIRSVNRIEQRISEADKLGMDVIVIPQGNLKGLDTKKFGITVKAVGKVSDVYQMLF